MEMGGQPGSDINEFPDTLDSRSLMEVTSSNRFPIARNESVLGSVR